MRPDALDSLRVLAIGLVLLAGVQWLAGGAQVLPGDWAVLLIQGLFLAVPLVYARAVRLAPLAVNGICRLRWRAAGLVLLASLGSMWLLKALADLQLELFPALEQDVRQLTRTVDRARGRGELFAMVALVAVPALCEEIFIRGLFFRGLLARFGPWRALILSTLVFAALHGTTAQAIMMLLTGLYFGAVVWLTGSVWAGVIAHAANNLVVLGVRFYLGERMIELRPPAWLLLLSLAVFAGAMALLALDRMKIQQKVTEDTEKRRSHEGPPFPPAG